MRKRPELPPELADAIELTAEYRHAMGLPARCPPERPRLPMSNELMKIPEWLAAMRLITAEEYLAFFGYSDQPIQMMRNGQAGESKLWKKKPRQSPIG